MTEQKEPEFTKGQELVAFWHSVHYSKIRLVPLPAEAKKVLADMIDEDLDQEGAAAKVEAESLREQLKQAQESNEQIEQHWRRMYDERWADAAKLSAEVARLRELLGHALDRFCEGKTCIDPIPCSRLAAEIRATLADPGTDSKEEVR